MSFKAAPELGVVAETSPWEPLVIAVAPNGARRTQVDHPALPMSAREIAAAAVACRDTGAALLHLHVRDQDGEHTLDPARYLVALDAVRAAVGDGLVVQLTTEAVGRYTAEEQMKVVRAERPEAVSLALRELMPPGAPEAPLARFLDWMIGEGIQPQYILYDAGDVWRFAKLCESGTVPARARNVLFVLGRYAVDQRSRPADLLPFLDAWRAAAVEAASWSVCAFGPQENACALTAAALGGHSRVGFENNLHLSDGSPAPDNAALVAQVRDGATLLGRPVADARQARRLMGA